MRQGAGRWWAQMEVLRFPHQSGAVRIGLRRHAPFKPTENSTGLWAFGWGLLQAERAGMRRSPRNFRPRTADAPLGARTSWLPANIGHSCLVRTVLNGIPELQRSIRFARSGWASVGSFGPNRCPRLVGDRTEHCPESRSGLRPLLHAGHLCRFTPGVCSGWIQCLSSEGLSTWEEISALGPSTSCCAALRAAIWLYLVLLVLGSGLPHPAPPASPCSGTPV